MYTNDYLLNKLSTFGFSNEKSTEIIGDMDNLFKNKLISEYYSMLDNNQRTILQKIGLKSINEYLISNLNTLPKISNEKITEIHKTIWDKLFYYMES